MIRRPPRSTLFPLHDALPIYPSPARDDRRARPGAVSGFFASGLVVDLVLALVAVEAGLLAWHRRRTDRKSTRLNSSHANISYAVFCLKKKKNILLYYA